MSLAVARQAPPVAVPQPDARRQLLAQLAAGPARRGYAIAYDLLGNRAEAEEAVQEALARACERIGELRDPAAAPAWLGRIVTTVCLRVLRRRRLRQKLFGRFERARPDSDDDAVRRTDAAAIDDAIVQRSHRAPAPTATTAMVEHERLVHLVRSLGDLPTKQRAALILRYGQGLPVTEVAALLGVEPATAKTHLVRGLARLREHFLDAPTEDR